MSPAEMLKVSPTALTSLVKQSLVNNLIYAYNTSRTEGEPLFSCRRQTDIPLAEKDDNFTGKYVIRLNGKNTLCVQTITEVRTFVLALMCLRK